jgi:hypothetical protein
VPGTKPAAASTSVGFLERYDPPLPLGPRPARGALRCPSARFRAAGARRKARWRRSVRDGDKTKLAWNQ